VGETNASRKIIARAIARLEKQGAERQARWKEACAAEQKERARRDELLAFVERYLKLHDDLARETVEWNVDDRRRYIFGVLREVRAERTRRSCAPNYVGF